MRSARLYRYDLPMDSKVILRDQKLTQREGLIVELGENGRFGLGEIAPLVGFSQESLEEALLVAQSQLALWVDGQPWQLESVYPSVAFGLSMAQLELEQGLPQQGQYSVAPLCSGDPDELIPIFQDLEGEKVAKIKIGLYEPIRDGLLVSLFLESIPDLHLRLDANRAWSQEKAQKFAQYIAPSLRRRIAFIEEPCHTPSDSLAFAIDSGIAIAWDETLQQALRDPAFRLETLTGVKALVIKPTLIGSVQLCIELFRKAQSLGMQVVISSSLESSLGLTQLARLSYYLQPEAIPGLDTLTLFKAQLITAWPNSDLPLQTLEQQTLVWSSLA